MKDKKLYGKDVSLNLALFFQWNSAELGSFQADPVQSIAVQLYLFRARPMASSTGSCLLGPTLWLSGILACQLGWPR